MIQKRIVFVLPNLMAGGAERVLITLMNNLDANKFDRHLVILSEYGTLRDWIAPDVTVHNLGNIKLRAAVPPLIKVFNKLTPDTVVSTMAGMNFSVLLTRPFLTNKPRIIVREAVVPSSIIESQILQGMVRAAYKTLYPMADAVIAPSQIIIDEFRDYLGMNTARHAVLPNPVDTARMLAHPFKPDTSEKRKKTVKFIAAGRLHKQKGFDRLIQALPKLQTPYDWELEILGAGPEEENLKNMIKNLNLDQHVFMPGLSKTPWPEYGAADAFLLPSRWEGLPNVALESLACGTPVIAMNEAGGIAEIAEDARKGAVQTTYAMDEFINAMADVVPNPSDNYRASLLPEKFEMQNVMHEFEKLL